MKLRRQLHFIAREFSGGIMSSIPRLGKHVLLTVLVLLAQWLSPAPASAAVPGEPIYPHLQSSTGTYIEISWEAPKTNAQSIIDYEIRYSSNDGSTWTDFSHEQSISTSIKITGLELYMNYRVQIRSSAGSSKSNWVDVLPKAFIEVAAGMRHACGLTVERTVRCWGSNATGQIGVGDSPSNWRPVDVLGGLENVKQIVAGSLHTCALLMNKTIKCWGNNDYGQLGDGTYLSKSLPVTVTDINNAIELDADSLTTCAVLEDGKLKCWGADVRGEYLDTGGNHSSTPVVKSGIGSVEHVAIGIAHTCVILTDKSVRCWGRNTTYQLGNPSALDSLLNIVQPVDTSNSETITAGPTNTCVTKTIGTVYCWGYKYWQAINWTPTIEPELQNVSEFGLGDGYACFIMQNADLKCWGQNWEGMLGIGYKRDPETSATLVDTGVKNAREIAAGSYSSAYVVLSDGRILSWGRDEDWRLGREYPSDAWQYRPNPITDSQPYLHLALPPFPITQLTSSLITKDSVTLSWEPGYSQGDPVTEYLVEYSQDDSTWISKNTTERTLKITGLKSASNYHFRVYAINTGGLSVASTVLEVTTKGYKNIPLEFTLPVSKSLYAGKCTWALSDKTFSSVSNIIIPTNGEAIIPSAPAGMSDLNCSFTFTDGQQMTYKWQVDFGDASLALTIPYPPEWRPYEVLVKLPNGLLVSGATVNWNGQLNFMENGIWSSPPPYANTSDGRYIFNRFTGGSVEVRYSNGQIQQNRTVQLQYPQTVIELEEMPWLEANYQTTPATSGSTVPISIKLSDNSTQAFSLRTSRISTLSSQIDVKIVPPKGAKQTCKKSLLTTKFATAGSKTLRVCATRSGIYKLVSTGAMPTKNIVLHVKGTPSMKIRELRATTPQIGQLALSWKKPEYTGGVAPKYYLVKVVNGGKANTYKTSKLSLLIKKLKHSEDTQVEVSVVTKYGTSELVRIVQISVA